MAGSSQPVNAGLGRHEGVGRERWAEFGVARRVRRRSGKARRGPVRQGWTTCRMAGLRRHERIRSWRGKAEGRGPRVERGPGLRSLWTADLGPGGDDVCTLTAVASRSGGRSVEAGPKHQH
ncbi:MAG: hypothetical protein M1815_002358 [Lichina confinis]|nr:MAG: hypothetical protein M1815_002358 [Lichina confinis]